MIKEIIGVSNIRMLYLQLLYRCNFRCRHCFHGSLLDSDDIYTREEVSRMLMYFKDEFGLQDVTFLGGEPLLHPEISALIRDTFEAGLAIDICSNGHYPFMQRLSGLASNINLLRISIEGLGQTNDYIRKAGSYDSAIESLKWAHGQGIRTGVTATINAYNIAEVPELAEILVSIGVVELKLHCLRTIGNAALHPELVVLNTDEYLGLWETLRGFKERGLEILFDTDLMFTPKTATNFLPSRVTSLDRIEVDPKGAVTLSCKAVGMDANAFLWDKKLSRISYEPTDHDELTCPIPNVNYESRAFNVL